MPNVDDPWTDEDIEVTDKTHTDIESNRTHNSNVTDSSRELHRFVATLVDETGLDVSQACDRAMRVALAVALDEHRVPFTREDYDVAYTIPPAGWATERVFAQVEPLPEDHEAVEALDRAVNFTTPDVVYEMAGEAIEAGTFDTYGDVIVAGCRRLLGQR
jgi:hypothetical protein